MKIAHTTQQQQQNPTQKWEEDLTRYSSKEEIQITNCIKRHLLLEGKL